MSNGIIQPDEPEQRVRVTIGVDLSNAAVCGTRLTDIGREQLLTDCRAVLNAPFNIPLAVYWFVREAWEKFFVYAGHGDPPPKPY